MSDFFTAESTGRANQEIDEILRDNMETTMKERGRRFGTIKPTPFLETKEGKQMILDMVVGSGSSAPLQIIRKGVGKLATNLMAPRNYSVKDKLSNLFQYIKEHGMKKTLKKVAKDEGILDMKTGINYSGKNRSASSVVDPDRDLPFRLMFDLKPRHSAAYKKIPKSYETGGGPFNVVRQVEFNPKTVAGDRLLESVRKSAERVTTHHPVMGTYKSTPHYPRRLNKDIVDYEDLWDFGLNKGDTRRIYEAVKGGSKGYLGVRDQVDEVGSYILRKLAESITNPVLIKGRTAPSLSKINPDLPF